MAFTVKSRLGRGKSVDSFAARLTVDDEQFDVVVKRPHAEYKDNQAFAEALLAWGEAQKEIEHDNLVAVLESGRTEEGPYVLCEMVTGAPLSLVILALKKRKRTLTASLAISIAEQMCAGLEYLHGKGIVHGSLDPGEVLISYDGEVKIGDQRLHALDQQLGKDLVAEADPYRAPEIQDVAKATTPADVYSFGLIVLEMLIGSPVWTSESMTVIGSVQALKDFTHVGQAQPGLTDDLVKLLGGCLAEDPEDRSSAAKALEKLKAIVAKHGVREDARTLGGFVEALIPRPEGDDAPTMMLDPAQAEELAQKQKEKLAEFIGQSVAIDPDMERKALTRAGRPPSVDEPPPQADAPVAPSVARSVSVPNVAKVAAQSTAEFEAQSSRAVKLTALALLGVIVLVFALSVLGRSEARTIQLKASSVPPGARVLVDGTDEGTTPFDQSIQVRGATVKLRFELAGHKPHEVSIGTEADELRYEAKLEAQ